MVPSTDVARVASRGHKPRAILALMTVFAVLFMGLGAHSAQAADVSGQLTNIKATVVGPTTLPEGSGSQVQFEFSACVPDSAVAGDSWSVKLPGEFRNWPKSFKINNPDDANDTWIDVTIVDGVATFALTASGAEQNSLCFVSKFGAQMSETLGQGEHEITFAVAGSQITAGQFVVTAPGTGTSKPYDKPQKWIWFTDASDQCRTSTDKCVESALVLPAGDNGVFTITDTAAGNWTFACGAYRLEKHTWTNGVLKKEGVSLVSAPFVKFESCSATELKVVVDTTGQPDNVAWVPIFKIDAKNPGGDGLVQYKNEATFKGEKESWTPGAATQSSYAGGFATGAHIKLTKKDEAGNDANTADKAADLPDGSTKLAFAIINNGTQDLRKIKVSDSTTGGTGGIGNTLVCTFPDGSKGTEWDGPLKSGASFLCEATLSGVKGTHNDTASVTAIGEAGTPVTDEDEYHATSNPVVSVGDYVWLDADHNGIQNDGETGIPGVVLTITGPDGKPVTGVDGKVVAPVTTDKDGKYIFEGLPTLPAGEGYTVAIDKAASAEALKDLLPTITGAGTTATDSSTDKVTSDADLSSNGAKDLTLDFGFYGPIDLTISKKLATSGTVKPGDTVEFTLTPRNNGPADAIAGWSVTDVLPKGLTLASVTGDSAAYDCAEATCTSKLGLKAGADGEPVTVKATVDADVKGKLHNVTYIAPAKGEVVETNPLEVPTSDTDTDKTPTNNDAQADVEVTVVVPPTTPDTPDTPDLPNTGSSNAGTLGLIALALLGAGGLLVWQTRRKNASV